MTELSNVTLAVLAGGAGRRMGGPKAWLTINGEPIVSRLHRRLNWPGPTLLITSPGREHPPGYELFKVEVVDLVDDQGPLRGVHTALSHATTPLVAVVPVDMPNLTVAPIEWLATVVDATPQMNGAWYLADGSPRPLPVVLRRELRDAALASIQQNMLQLKRWELDHNVQPLTPAEPFPIDFFRNLNEPEDLRNLSS